MSPRYHIPVILSFVSGQHERLVARPDVAEGLPFGPAALDAGIEHVYELERAQKAAKKAVEAATDALHKAARELRDLAWRNIAGVVARSGKTSPDLNVVGAKPLREPRGPSRKKKSGTEAPTGGSGGTSATES